MGFVIHPAEPAGIDVAVGLCSGKRAVSEKLLDHAQVGAALQEVGRERVPKPMRVGEQAADRARVQSPAARRQEQCILGSARELRPRSLEVATKPVRSFLPKGYDAFLAAFAPDVNGLLLEVDVAQVEVDGFATAQPGRVHELEERTVPKRQRVVACDLIENGIDFLGLRSIGEPARSPRA
jgi:hypothetical protein